MKWVHFALYWIGRKLSRFLPARFSLGSNNKPHFDPLKTPPTFYSSFLENLGNLKSKIETLQKEKFTTKAIYTSLEQQKTAKPRAETCWASLGHKVASWAAVWRSCFEGPSLGRENDVTYLITHCVIKTGLYLKYTWNMPTVNERCIICNTPKDIEHLFINCTSATRVWKHFLPLLNKVLPMRQRWWTCSYFEFSRLKWIASPTC